MLSCFYARLTSTVTGNLVVGSQVNTKSVTGWSGLPSIFAHEVDELALNADPVGAENARLIGRIGGL
jgi:hypothetical protein